MTGVKVTAELLEQVDPVGPTVGTTRAAVFAVISETRDLLFRMGLNQHYWAGARSRNLKNKHRKR